MPAVDLSVSPRAIWRLAWPQTLMMYCVFIMSFTPVWTAGRLSAEVQAAFGMAAQCVIFLSILCMGLSSGATAAISQALGDRNERRAGFYVSTTVALSFLLGLLLALPGYFFAEAIASAVGLPEATQPAACQIWRIMMAGLPLTYVYDATCVIFRATRRVIAPLATAAGIMLLHAYLCIGLGLGCLGLPALGLDGIAWAGVAANAAGAVANCLLLWRLGFLARRRIPRKAWLKRGVPYLLKVAGPACIASLVWHSGYFVLFVLVSTLPFNRVASLAGLTAGLRIESILFLPGMAFHMTAAVMVGNCLGAGRREDAMRVSWTLIKIAVAIMSLVALAMWPFRPELAAFLSDDAPTRECIVSYLSWNLASTPFSIASTVLGGVMVGAGATRYNLLTFGSTFWGLRIPLGWWLGHVLWQDASGVFCAMLVSQIVQSLAMSRVLQSRHWQNCAMRSHRRGDG